MKRLMVAIILIVVSLTGYSQIEMKNYYEKYIKHCNTIVDSTVKIEGSVVKKLVPVYNNCNQIKGYKMATETDTTWETPVCPQYKRDGDAYRWYGGRVVVTCDSISVSSHGLYYYNDDKEVVKTVYKRVKCTVYKEKPSSEGFADWIFKYLQNTVEI